MGAKQPGGGKWPEAEWPVRGNVRQKLPSAYSSSDEPFLPGFAFNSSAAQSED
jgi:hypothetical protein